MKPADLAPISSAGPWMTEHEVAFVADDVAVFANHFPDNSYIVRTPPAGLVVGRTF